uniref:Uncharacterized protein n=1 Tax=Arundo donax TaxID=35708 RepID=A0A0A9FAY6_ARUDO
MFTESLVLAYHILHSGKKEASDENVHRVSRPSISYTPFGQRKRKAYEWITVLFYMFRKRNLVNARTTDVW